MLRNERPIKRRNPSGGWGFCCWCDQINGQGITPHKLATPDSTASYWHKIISDNSILIPPVPDHENKIATTILNKTQSIKHPAASITTLFASTMVPSIMPHRERQNPGRSLQSDASIPLCELDVLDHDIPVPGIPTVVLTPLFPTLTVAPGLPIDVETPLLLRFKFMPGAILIRLRNFNAIFTTLQAVFV